MSLDSKPEGGKCDIGPVSSRRRMLKTAGVAVVGSVGLAGCMGGNDGGGGGGTTPNQTDTNTTTDTDDSLETVKITTAHFGLWDVTIPHLVADEKGFYQDEGVKAERVDVSGGGSVMRAIASGDIDFATTASITGTMAAFREGIDIRIIGNQWNASSDMTWYAKESSNYKTLEDASDAKIAFSAPGSSTQMMVLRAIEYGGLSNAEPVAAGGPPEANSALKTGEVDLAWTVPPFFFDGIKSGEYTEIFRGIDIPPFDDMSVRVSLSSERFLNNKPDTAKSFFKAYYRGLTWAYDNLDEAVKIWGGVIDNDNYEQLKSIVNNTYKFDQMNPHRMRNLDTAMKYGQEYDFIDSELSQDELDELITTKHLPSIDA